MRSIFIPVLFLKLQKQYITHINRLQKQLTDLRQLSFGAKTIKCKGDHSNKVFLNIMPLNSSSWTNCSWTIHEPSHQLKSLNTFYFIQSSNTKWKIKKGEKMFMTYHLMNKTIRNEMSVQGQQIYESFMKHKFKNYKFMNHSWKKLFKNYIIMNDSWNSYIHE